MRPQNLPKLWYAIAIACCGLSEAQAGHWWAALGRSRWTVPREWRQRLLGFDALPDPGPDAVLGWLGEHATPGILVELLELLVRERQLTRRSANRLMEGLLARVDAKGAWK